MKNSALPTVTPARGVRWRKVTPPPQKSRRRDSADSGSTDVWHCWAGHRARRPPLPCPRSSGSAAAARKPAGDARLCACSHAGIGNPIGEFPRFRDTTADSGTVSSYGGVGPLSTSSRLPESIFYCDSRPLTDFMQQGFVLKVRQRYGLAHQPIWDYSRPAANCGQGPTGNGPCSFRRCRHGAIHIGYDRLTCHRQLSRTACGNQCGEQPNDPHVAHWLENRLDAYARFHSNRPRMVSSCCMRASRQAYSTDKSQSVRRGPWQIQIAPAPGSGRDGHRRPRAGHRHDLARQLRFTGRCGKLRASHRPHRPPPGQTATRSPSRRSGRAGVVQAIQRPDALRQQQPGLPPALLAARNPARGRGGFRLGHLASRRTEAAIQAARLPKRKNSW